MLKSGILRPQSSNDAQQMSSFRSLNMGACRRFDSASVSFPPKAKDLRGANKSVEFPVSLALLAKFYEAKKGVRN